MALAHTKSPPKALFKAGASTANVRETLQALRRRFPDFHQIKLHWALARFVSKAMTAETPRTRPSRYGAPAQISCRGR